MLIPAGPASVAAALRRFDRVRSQPQPQRGAPAGAIGPGKAVDCIFAALQRWGNQRAARLAAAGFVTLVAVGTSVQRHSTIHGVIAVAAAFAATAPLMTLRRHPAVSLVVMLGVQASMLVFGRLSWTAPMIAVWLLTLALCPLRLRRGGAVAALVATELAVVAAIAAPAGVNSTPWDVSGAEAAIVLVAWGIGESIRDRQATRQEQHATALRVRALRSSDASSRERVALARDLHDVVAHHVSLIAVKSATARYAVDGLPADAVTAFDDIATAARTALAELRTVLGVLRAPDSPIPDTPVRGLDDLPELVSGEHEQGIDITLRMTVNGANVPASAQLCVYRLVQEALTNCRRHAAGSRVHVDIQALGTELWVRVRDDGGPSPRLSGAQAEAGFGLQGIRERVNALSGSVSAGPRPGGGFEVAARIPLATPAA